MVCVFSSVLRCPVAEFTLPPSTSVREYSGWRVRRVFLIPTIRYPALKTHALADICASLASFFLLFAFALATIRALAKGRFL